MKKIILISTIAILSTNISFAQKQNKYEEIKIKTSAVCEMCKTTIEKAMAYEKGVKSFELDLKTKVLTVKYNPKKTTPEKIKKAVTLVGYNADEMPADSKGYEKLPDCCKKDGHNK